MSLLLVYAGPNGSGKSSLRDLGEVPDPVDEVIDPDRIARTLDPEAPHHANAEAGRQALAAFAACLATGQSMSLETTLAGRSVLSRLRLAREAGYRIQLRYIALESVALNIQRVRARAAAGGHFIPPEIIRRRYTSSLANLPEALRLTERATVVDNSGEIHRVVLEIAGNELLHVADPIPRWLQPLMPQISRR
ncbi:hypothetical protein EBE87_24075 [Pseudoroseomonas wenyumeiae]|uniref:Zeta toxin domain-containing protein n=1 Tax=Teichococcus wenyumeiae TaxID=2478470 RepID=A0ABX9VDJ6_9PROT|nr:AAA family ATPase [Pseudoroseomonas wenyumeiae]RMI17067.1 hypothetical protein EBE87_24075 [Pseudoroseomonas wenyumeiae]